MLMMREFSSHSSHQKSSDSLDCPETHVKRSVNCRSGAISLRRVNSMSNWPEVVEQGDASAVTTPVQVRCISRISETRTSRKDKSGLQSWATATCGAPDRAMLAASKIDRRERPMSLGLLSIVQAMKEKAARAEIEPIDRVGCKA